MQVVAGSKNRRLDFHRSLGGGAPAHFPNQRLVIEPIKIAVLCHGIPI